MENTDNELFIEKDKYHFIKILLPILLIGGIIFGGYYYYHNYLNNSNHIIKNTIKKINESLIDELNKESDFNSFKVNGLVKFDIDLGKENKKIAELVNNLSIQLDSEINVKKEIASIDFNAKYLDKKPISIKTYTENNKYYFYLDNIYDKYIEISNMDELNSIKELESKTNIKINNNDIKIMINSFSEALTKALNNTKIERKEETITINNQSIKANNYYLNLKNQEINDFFLNILNTLKDDKDYRNVIKKVDEDNIDELINKLKTNIITDNYNFNIYLTNSLFKPELLRFQFKVSDLTIQIDFIDKNQISLLMSINDKKDSSIELDITHNDASYNIDYHIKYSVPSDNQETFKIDGTINIEKTNNIQNRDISNSIKIEDLSIEDRKKIQNALNTNETLNAILKQAEPILQENKQN